MTDSKSFKRRVRERMSKTGESYTAARSQVAPKRERVEATKRLAAASQERIADNKLADATGKTWDEWFVLLDSWGAKDRKHPDIVRHLIDDLSVPGWWAQTITVGYERARGMRLKHQQPDGFAVSASKTVAVPVEVLFDAFVKAPRRNEWLTDGAMTIRTSIEHRTARFNWEDGSTRVVVGFIDKGPAKSTVAISHEKLPDAYEAERAKALWKDRLTRLKGFLEG